VYLRLLLIQPIKLTITFSLSPTSGAASSANPLDALLSLIAHTVANIDAATICLNALVLEHASGPTAEVTGRITAHYAQQAAGEIYKVLGSADVLGNPVGLVGSLGTGVKSFFYEPIKGLRYGVKGFGRGVAKGTAGLVKGAVQGTFNTASRVTATVAKGIAQLSMDPAYLEKRRARSSRRIRHAGDGLKEGTLSLGRGIVDGVSGVVLKPWQGLKAGGAKGFAKGVAQGLIGVVVRPVAGVLDFASDVTAGIRNTTTFFDKDKGAMRVRLPRLFTSYGALEPYDGARAFGMNLLCVLEDGKYADLRYVHHEKVGPIVYVLTTSRLLAVSAEAESVKWHYPWSTVRDVQPLADGSGVAISVDRRSKLLRRKKVSTKIITTATPDRAIVLYSKFRSCMLNLAKVQSVELGEDNLSEEDEDDDHQDAKK
jgi:hypothetical protein